MNTEEQINQAENRKNKTKNILSCLASNSSHTILKRKHEKNWKTLSL